MVAPLPTTATLRIHVCLYSADGLGLTEPLFAEVHSEDSEDRQGRPVEGDSYMQQTTVVSDEPRARPTGARAAQQSAARPTVRGKSLFQGDRKLTVKGVTYGPFSSDPDGGFEPETAAADFQQMADAGINSIRVYTPPERWLLDLAHEHGLLVMVGIPWEQHVAFLDSGRAQAIEETVRQTVRSCAGHPAVLCYAIGNEIPSSIVRWHGRKRTERFLGRLCRAAKDEDSGALVTYVNYPSTEYLRLPTFDFLAFNVYLEQQPLLERYLARLQNLADDRPLMLAEVGLDSRRNGTDGQAETLAWQLETTFESGCAGVFVFAWTDQWHRGGHDIEDWDFGLTTRERSPKPALEAVHKAFTPSPSNNVPSPAPKVSVVICTYNGAATLRECLEGVLTLHYPSYEVIVVSDGSTDGSAAIAEQYEGVRLIETPQRGLAAARNTGLWAATGEIVAYIDDDAIPDPDWLTHIAGTFGKGGFAAVGGPNVLPTGSNAVSECVANAPGGPTHVLVSDREAEHVPGCNMAIRRADLEEIEGFDPQFRAAGDDVDVCWRLLDSGKRIAFSPGAVVWHHRRRSVRAYLRQQRGYGRAEALLERKHPDKYSAAGHVDWAGRLYGNGAAQHRGGWRWRVYYGGWGTAFYQSLYGPRSGLLESLPLMPEWYLTILVLALLSGAGVLWQPLLLAVPLLGLAIGALLVDATLGASRARFSATRGRWRLRVLTGLLYLLQPLARLYGRISHGLTPWRRRGPRAFALPLRRDYSFWNETWQSTEERVRAIAVALRADGSVIRSGGDWDSWDLQVRGGMLGAARLRIGVEEHGAGRQLVRARAWPWAPPVALVLGALVATLAVVSLLNQTDAVTWAFGLAAAALAGRLIYECGAATATVRKALYRPAQTEVQDSPAEALVPATLGPEPLTLGTELRQDT
jgi:glycosyltransferase involved in cell wall biosynthesis